MNKTGIHRIGDLHQCDLSNFAPDKAALEDAKLRISEMLSHAGIQELGSHYHFFAPHAATAVISLAESHLAFHTWPEDAYASIDLFTCSDSSARDFTYERLFLRLIHEIFRSQKYNLQKILRERTLGIPKPIRMVAL